MFLAIECSHYFFCNPTEISEYSYGRSRCGCFHHRMHSTHIFFGKNNIFPKREAREGKRAKGKRKNRNESNKNDWFHFTSNLHSSTQPEYRWLIEFWSEKRISMGKWPVLFLVIYRFYGQRMPHQNRTHLWPAFKPSESTIELKINH